MQLILAHVFKGELVGRLSVICAEVRYRSDIDLFACSATCCGSSCRRSCAAAGASSVRSSRNSCVVGLHKRAIFSDRTFSCDKHFPIAAIRKDRETAIALNRSAVGRRSRASNTSTKERTEGFKPQRNTQLECSLPNSALAALHCARNLGCVRIPIGPIVAALGDSRTRSPSRRTIIRWPSCFISWIQPGPLGGDWSWRRPAWLNPFGSHLGGVCPAIRNTTDMCEK